MTQYPEQVSPLGATEKFTFSCHSEVGCFTECCRSLELSLHPYDIRRLCKSLGITSQQFIDAYAVIEFSDEDLFPKVYLGMVDDGRDSCPFVNRNGCSVYDDRPAACRTYPLGRGVYHANNQVQEMFVLVHEPHCLGFAQNKEYTAVDWHKDQGIIPYTRHNDIFLPIFNAPYFRSGNRLTDKEAELFVLALFNTDQLSRNYPNVFANVLHDDALFFSAIVKWLGPQLFHNKS